MLLNDLENKVNDCWVGYAVICICVGLLVFGGLVILV